MKLNKYFDGDYKTDINNLSVDDFVNILSALKKVGENELYIKMKELNKNTKIQEGSN
jgi:hypothetical protein